jgi:hypothetical protein
VPTDNGSDGGSKGGSKTAFTATDNTAEGSAADSCGSRGSKSVHPSASLSRTREEKAAQPEENDSKRDMGLELRIDTTFTTTGEESGTAAQEAARGNGSSGATSERNANLSSPANLVRG